MRISACLFLCILLLAACRRESLAEAAPGFEGTSPKQSAIKLAALDDPANPYRTSYHEWDNWIFEHVDTSEAGSFTAMRPIPPNAEEISRLAFDEADPNLVALNVRVDKNGCLVPLLEAIRMNAEARSAGSLQDSINSYTWVRAVGTMDRAIRQEMYDRVDEVKARYYMPIPEWLIRPDNLPEHAMLLPNGDVITMGQLGSGNSEALTHESSKVVSNSIGHDDKLFYRYNSQGELVASTASHWWFLYYGHIKPLPATIDFRKDGNIYFLDEAGNIEKKFGFDAREYSGPDPQVSMMHLQFLGPKQLKVFYDAQSRGAQQ